MAAVAERPTSIIHAAIRRLVIIESCRLRDSCRTFAQAEPTVNVTRVCGSRSPPRGLPAGLWRPRYGRPTGRSQGASRSPRTATSASRNPARSERLERRGDEGTVCSIWPVDCLRFGTVPPPEVCHVASLDTPGRRRRGDDPLRIVGPLSGLARRGPHGGGAHCGTGRDTGRTARAESAGCDLPRATPGVLLPCSTARNPTGTPSTSSGSYATRRSRRCWRGRRGTSLP